MLLCNVKNEWDVFFSNFVAFSEYLNFISKKQREHTTRGRRAAALVWNRFQLQSIH